MTTSPSRIKIVSPAKLNLYLEISGSRDDGYHELCMLNTAIDFGDEVEVEFSGEGIQVEGDHPDLPRGRDNICTRAAEAFFLRFPQTRSGIKIRINKNIPMGGGLGGGSSNAAAVLFALSKMSGVEIANDDLIELSSGIGADVPFFLFRSPAWVSGKGEILEDAPPLPQWTFLLACLDFEVETAWAYSAWDLTSAGKGDNLESLGKRDTLPIPDKWRNDLELVVGARFPEVNKAKQALIDAGSLGAMMSGSGSSVFGVFPDDESASEAQKTISRSLDVKLELAHARSGPVIREAV